jgi:hypothetical protein
MIYEKRPTLIYKPPVKFCTKAAKIFSLSFINHNFKHIKKSKIMQSKFYLFLLISVLFSACNNAVIEPIETREPTVFNEKMTYLRIQNFSKYELQDLSIDTLLISALPAFSKTKYFEFDKFYIESGLLWGSHAIINGKDAWGPQTFCYTEMYSLAPGKYTLEIEVGDSLYHDNYLYSTIIRKE